jgi:hypothetical protein
MSRQQANIVIVEHAADPTQVLSMRQSTSEVNHVLYCGPKESLFDFSERVLYRVKSVREKHCISRVAYVQADSGKQSATRQMLCRSIVALLNDGAEFELVTVCCPGMDLLLAVDSLIPVAKAGVRVSAVKASAVSQNAGRSELRPVSVRGLRSVSQGFGRLNKESAAEVQRAELAEAQLA